MTFETLAANFIAQVVIPLERKGVPRWVPQELRALLMRVHRGELSFSQAKAEYKTFEG